MKTKLFLSISLFLPLVNLACDEAALAQTMQRFSTPPQAVADEKPGNEGGDEEGCEEGGDEGDDEGGDEGGGYCCVSDYYSDHCYKWCD